MYSINRFIIVFFILSSTIVSAQKTKVDELTAKLNSSQSDTTRASICIDISKEYTTSSPDSSIFWIQRSLEFTPLCSNNNLNDSVFCFIRADAHIEWARVYVLNNRHLDWGKSHIDTATAILYPFMSSSQIPSLAIKSKGLLSKAYSVLGRISLNRGNMNEAIVHFTNSLEMMQDIGNENGMARMNNNLGVLHRRQSNFAQSLHFFQKALNYFEENNDTISIAGILTNIGSVSFDIGAYEKSLENYLTALSIFERSDNQESLATTLINIGGVMVASDNAKESNQFYRRALKISEKINDKRGVATSYLSLGISFKEQNLLDSAFIFLSKSLDTFKAIQDKMGESDAYQNIGEVYFQQKKYVAAHNSFNYALVIAKEIGLNSVIANANHSLALTFLEQGNIEKAIEKAMLALSVSKKHNLLGIEKDIHLTISKIYERQADYQKSLFHHKIFFDLHDSIYSTDRAHKFAEMETLYQLEQKQAAITELQREKELNEMELKNAELRILSQRTHSIFTLGVLLFLSVILFLLYRQFREKRFSNSLLKQQNSEIIQKNMEIELQRNELESQKEILKEKSEQLEKFNWLITDSIDYASSIQGALLPSEDLVSLYFDDLFIVFFPKDVVSGDFYWAYPRNESIIVALADCTGHGVPGGFMSMLGISALTELMGRQIVEPSDILNNLRLLVIESLKQTGKIGEHQEGMDISIISYTQGNSYIDFAGANHPIWIVRESNGSFELIEQKGDRMPISYHTRMQPFNSYRIDVKKGDQIYLFSDGFRHQLGGKSFNEKYGKENFKKLLLSNSHLPMENQKSIIEDAFFRWVSGYDQLDDIAVMGLKI